MSDIEPDSKQEKLLYNAQKAYLAHCEFHLEPSVYHLISDAIEEGSGHITVRGFIPNNILDQLHNEGYTLRVTECSTLNAPFITNVYLIQWATGDMGEE